jgi:hypothetical protein
MNEVNVVALRDLSITEFADIVAYTSIRHANELRIVLTDGSFLDIWFSLTIADRYSYHWARRLIDARSIATIMHEIKIGNMSQPGQNIFTTAARRMSPRAISAMTRQPHSVSF